VAEKELKPILIITYYWPPSGGAGVQRWLKFSKYLPEYGWRPIIFTPENPDFDLKDHSLLKDLHPQVEVLKFPIWEPYKFFKKLSGQKELKQGQVLEDGRGSLLKAFAISLRGNLFVPDPKRFWIKPSVNYLRDILDVNGIKHVVTTGPPHSMHLIGLKLKYFKPSLIWIADFRDPWSKWEILQKMRISQFIWKKHLRLEQEVLKAADSLLVTSPGAASEFNELGARKIKVITNGFDQKDFAEHENYSSNELFQISHIGMLNEQRSAPKLWEKINQLIEKNSQKRIRVRLTGIISESLKRSLFKYSSLKGKLEITDSLPHKELSAVFAQSDLLLLVQSKTDRKQTQLPGKLFEYLQAKKPILAIGDIQSDMAEILKYTDSGECFSFDDGDGIENFLNAVILGQRAFQFKNIMTFDRSRLTKDLSDWLFEF